MQAFMYLQRGAYKDGALARSHYRGEYHWFPFCEAFQKKTSESVRLSLVKAMPFPANVQHRVESY